MSDDLDELRKKKMAELKEQVAQKERQEEMQKQVESQRQKILHQILEPEARQRLTNLRLTREDMVRAVENQLIRLAQAGQIKGKIDDKTLKQMLKKLYSQKKDSKIRIRRK